MTKKLILYVKLLFAFCFLVQLTFCAKYKEKLKDVASVSVINAVVDGTTVCLGGNPNGVANYSLSKLVLLAGDYELYVWPYPDSTHPYCSKYWFTADVESTYSLFVGGAKSNPACLLVKDSLPLISDSAFGVRFINLSPNSPPLNITLSTAPTLPEVSNLGYFTNPTRFKQYPAKSTNASYTFQFRKTSDNTVVASYSFSTIPRFANVTLALAGMIGGSGTQAIRVIRLTNDR